ncbi:MAG: hypothetical protein IPQ13_06245 [Holophagaceae bacterium]|nr:hypothetical protein [Holophagaceae bacterium]
MDTPGPDLHQPDAGLAALRAAAERDPDDSGTVFQLALKCRDAGRSPEAIRWFQRRLEQGGWVEELWYSMLQICLLHQSLGQMKEADEWGRKAFQYRPGRAEAALALSRIALDGGRHAMALLYANMAARTPLSKDVLFVDPAAYGLDPWLVISIAAYYAGLPALGIEACEQVLASREASWEDRNQTRNNAFFYLEPCPGEKVPFEWTPPPIEGNPAHSYRPMNPSLWFDAETGRRYGSIRHVNFDTDGGNYTSLAPDRQVRTRNFWVEWDPAGRILQSFEIIDELDWERIEFPVKGLEDLRLFHHRGRWKFTCTSYEKTGQPQMLFGLLAPEPDRSSRRWKVESLRHIQGAEVRPIEKNWLPFLDSAGELKILYHSDPTRIGRLDEAAGELVIESVLSPEWNGVDFRGSAPPIQFRGGYLYLVHEVAFEEWRRYTHRFVWMDSGYKIQRVSRPFYFDTQGVEFAMGLVWDGGHLWIGYGWQDKEARLRRMTEAELDQLWRFPACASQPSTQPDPR